MVSYDIIWQDIKAFHWRPVLVFKGHKLEPAFESSPQNTLQWGVRPHNDACDASFRTTLLVSYNFGLVRKWKWGNRDKFSATQLRSSYPEILIHSISHWNKIKIYFLYTILTNLCKLFDSSYVMNRTCIRFITYYQRSRV